MLKPSRFIWLMALLALVFFAAAVVTLRAAERAAQPASQPVTHSPRKTQPPARPAPSAPEESATIVDDPTTAPDASQSADNNVSFPTDI